MLQHKLIDYRLLADACQYYDITGYEQVEVPWIVDATFSRMTSPSGDDGWAFVLANGNHLVCSAEQGFVQMVMDGKLKPARKYFAVSPCFRDETLDETHSKWFVKLELFYFGYQGVGINGVSYDMLIDANRFAHRVGATNTKIIRTELGLDLIHDGLEIGSYGTRQIGDNYIAYGTGAALPRLQLAIEAAR